MEDLAKMYPPISDKKLPTTKTVMVAYPEGEESILFMKHTHSMFLDCIPVMHKELDQMCWPTFDWLSTIHYADLQNYPQPSYADVMVILEEKAKREGYVSDMGTACNIHLTSTLWSFFCNPVRFTRNVPGTCWYSIQQSVDALFHYCCVPGF